MAKIERIHIRISEDLKAKAQAAAERENRTLSNYIINLINEDLKGEKEMKNIETKTTYVVITTDGQDEWIEYTGHNLEEAKEIAQNEFYRNEKSKQNYTVELREMSYDYNPEDANSPYNYDLVEFVEITWHQLNEANLDESIYNGDGTSDLIFTVKGKKVLVRNVPTPEDADVWYWEDRVLTKEMMQLKPDQIEIQ